VTPGGLDVRESYPYGHYITVGTGDNFGVAVPELVKTRSVPNGIVIRRPKRTW
jgi:hypothetical protein